MSADRNVASGQFGPQVQVHQYEGTRGTATTSPAPRSA